MRAIVSGLAAVSGLASFSGTAGGAMLENLQFNDPNNTALNGVANTGTSPSQFGAAGNIRTLNGNLNVTVGSAPDAGGNVFRNTNSHRNLSTGIVTMTFVYAAASFAGPDTAGSNFGFGLRDTGANTADSADDTDLFTVRLHEQAGELRLQHRIGNTNTDVFDFNAVTLVAPLEVTVVANLETDTMSITRQLGNGTPVTVSNISFTPGLEFDTLRLSANTNSTDWGAGDSVDIDYLTVDHAVPEPASVALLGLAALSLRRRRR